MIATSLEKENIPTASNGKSKGISWPEFQKKYLDREDGYKYEWVNKEVVKSKHMDHTQSFILRNLMRLFRSLVNKRGLTGEMQSETDIFFGGNHRRPDICYLTDEQIDRTAYGENQVPQFVIEIISTKDQMNLVHEKMENYREANVKIVWHIFPLIKQVHVYSGNELENMKVCKGEDICSATSVIPDYELTVNAVLFMQPKPIEKF
jgi:Uma2 family endonuclease